MLNASAKPKPVEDYLNGEGLGDHLHWLRVHHPDLFAILDLERCDLAERNLPALNSASWEFEAERDGGRARAYNLAQRHIGNRALGMEALLGLLGGDSRIPGQDFRLLDVLGGDGTLARFCAAWPGKAPTVYTADISRFMIESCRAQGLACLRQPADCSLISNNALDGVLIAYGSHHLTDAERQQAVTEGWRTLRPGGRLVLHDFEEGRATARWFAEVVDPFSRTGHPYPHFTREEMHGLLSKAGFVGVEVLDLDDPFTLDGQTAEQARRAAVIHMYEMYDLSRFPGDPEILLEPLIAGCFGPIRIEGRAKGYTARIDRKAMVAVGTKPTRTQE